MPRTRSILIVESGATKARWRYLSDGGVRAFDSPGINFSSMGAEEVGRRIAAAVKAVGADVTRPQKVVFYGAGLLSDEAGAFFPGSEVECASDLLAAARAVCGHKEGIAAILGTGSNSCHFDGEKIVKNVHPSGFILGDEGSGAVLGKYFLSDYFKDLVPEALAAEFAMHFESDYAAVVGKVYRSAAPAAYLGSFAPWILGKAQEGSEYARTLIEENFRAFCSRCLSQYDLERLEVGIVGGFGCAAKDYFLPVAESFGVRISGFYPDIIDSLVEYHDERR